jgi:hypothetical protein
MRWILGLGAAQNCRSESIVDFCIAAFSNEKISEKMMKNRRKMV